MDIKLKMDSDTHGRIMVDDDDSGWGVRWRKSGWWVFHGHLDMISHSYPTRIQAFQAYLDKRERDIRADEERDIRGGPGQ